MKKLPSRLQAFMNAAMREMCLDNFWELLEAWGINEDEYQEIEEWFEKQGVDL